MRAQRLKNIAFLSIRLIVNKGSYSVMFLFIVFFSRPTKGDGQNIPLDSLAHFSSAMELESFISDSLMLYPKSSFKDMKNVLLKRSLLNKSITPNTIRSFSELYGREIGPLELVPFLEKLRSLTVENDQLDKAVLFAITSDILKFSEYQYPSTDEKFDSITMNWYASRKYFYGQLVLFQEMNYYMGIHSAKHNHIDDAEKALHSVFMVRPFLISTGDQPRGSGWDDNMKNLFEIQKKAFLALAKLYAEHPNEIEDVEVKFGILRGKGFFYIYLEPEIRPIFNKYLKMAGQEIILEPSYQMKPDSN
ncbi:MAG: hypothetical protein RIC19_10635 [Phaeodactylibacter sp.]|uniref:hypothetical protein n=1 Tax=Phaeodactylibacter sp. TaxID=1940289 RepID=UPI0032ED7E04